MLIFFESSIISILSLTLCQVIVSTCLCLVVFNQLIIFHLWYCSIIGPNSFWILASFIILLIVLNTNFSHQVYTWWNALLAKMDADMWMGSFQRTVINAWLAITDFCSAQKHHIAPSVIHVHVCTCRFESFFPNNRLSISKSPSYKKIHTCFKLLFTLIHYFLEPVLRMTGLNTCAK